MDPRHTALVLVDMQRDFVAPDGLFGTLGIDLSMYDETLPRLAGLLAAARHRGVAVIPVQNTALAEGRSEGSEPVVRKYRSSGFWGTNLDLVLRSNGIKTVVVTGCTTEGCLESTARDAMFCDYYVVVATGCVGSDDREQHDASMLLMRHRFHLAASDEIMDLWSADPREQHG